VKDTTNYEFGRLVDKEEKKQKKQNKDDKNAQYLKDPYGEARKKKQQQKKMQTKKERDLEIFQ